ncbi:MAG: IS21 family transposase [Bacteroidota bacterium]
MLLLRRLLQLKEQGSSNRQIATILRVSRNTLNTYMTRIDHCGISYAKLLKLSDEALAAIAMTDINGAEKSTVKHKGFDQRLKYFAEQLKNKKTTKQILWEEYREEDPGGYSRSQFCELLRRQEDIKDAVMHFEHPPAELMEFDFAGDSINYVNLQTGEIVNCVVLVCRLPCSGYTYIEALPNGQRLWLIAALGRALHYFGGVPFMVRTDNMAQIVTKANRYEPSFDELAQQWSGHYNTTLTATRVAKPRDKAGVESSVNTAYYRVYAPLRNQDFHSLVELNKAILEKTEKLNHSKYQGRDYSRYEKFISLEQSLLRPLPDEAFAPKTTRSVKVAKNYHVMLGEDRHFYSVPYQQIGKQVSLVYDTENVEIYINLQRIASHKRDFSKNGYTTLAEHMPSNHRHYLEQRGWDEEYFLKESTSIGENTVAAIRIILKQKTFIQQTYLSCKGTLRLAKKYGKDRLEAACARALFYDAKITYGALNRILEKNLDKQPRQTAIPFSLPKHDNLRGADSYG